MKVLLADGPLKGRTVEIDNGSKSVSTAVCSGQWLDSKGLPHGAAFDRVVYGPAAGHTADDGSPWVQLARFNPLDKLIA